MRKLIRRILHILDGTPQPDQKKQRGQSTVELALVTPLLIILLVGLVEVGWFARNYLVLLEVTRVGARRGAVMSAENSPIFWDSSENGRQAVLFHSPNTDPDFDDRAATDPGRQTELAQLRFNVRNCPPDPNATPNVIGFYNLVMCQMINSMAPLEIRNNDIDDIVISAFAIQVINNQPADGDLNLLDTAPINDDEFATPGFTPVVVGRWPTRANECNVWLNQASGQAFVFADDPVERDPFDYYRQNQPPLNNESDHRGSVDLELVLADPDGTGPAPIESFYYPLELAFEDANSVNGFFSTSGFDPYGQPETQRGFVLTGQRQVEERRTFDISGSPVELVSACWGSDKDVYWVQERLEGREFIMSQTEIDTMRLELNDPTFCSGPGGVGYCDQREFFVNQGLVLVEIYWQHQLLLDLPVFSPIYNALDDTQTTIEAWSAFPAPSITPELRYNLEPGDFVDLDG
ncbi:MAG: TadE/TadG family type IV pilus assembly protein [Phototrophicaceae bacterium]